MVFASRSGCLINSIMHLIKVQHSTLHCQEQIDLSAAIAFPVGEKTKQLYKMLCCVIIFLSVSQSLHFSPEGHISFCIQLLSSAQGVDVLFHFDFFSPNLHSPSKMSLRSGVCSAANRHLGLTVFGFPIVADSESCSVSSLR